jgi:hypothetical protein
MKAGAQSIARGIPTMPMLDAVHKNTSPHLSGRSLAKSAVDCKELCEKKRKAPLWKKNSGAIGNNHQPYC